PSSVSLYPYTTLFRSTLEVVDGSERLDELLEEGFRVEASGWKSRAGTAIASRPDTRRFYTDVARWASDRGWLRLAFLRLGGRALDRTSTRLNSSPGWT